MIPNIVTVGDAVEQRFQQIGQMLVGTPPKHSPEVQEIATNKAAVRGLSHFEAAVRTMVTLRLAYLLWIFTEIPGGVGFVIMTGSLGMAVSSMPQLPVSLLLVPAAVSVAFASILYIFVMPQLSSFAGLGADVAADRRAVRHHLPGRGGRPRLQVLGPYPSHMGFAVSEGRASRRKIHV